MATRDPFGWLAPDRRRATFFALLAATIAVMIALQILGAPLCTDAAPAGIITFELAGDRRAAAAVIDSWGARERVYAGLNLGLDYLFLVLYPATIGLGCALVAGARAQTPALARALVLCAWAQPVAGLLDAVENAALIQLLLGHQADFWPALARGCALPKFAIVAAGLLCLVAGAIVARIRGRRSPRT